MRVYVMTDLEGVAGVLDSENWCLPGSRYYDAARNLLTREVNAAVEGFLAAGVTEVLVADGHGPGGINPDLLHPAAELSRNWPVGKAYPFSLDSRKFDFAACVGQHPKAGTVGGHLCHTQSMDCRDECINGISVGEFGEMVFCAGELGVRHIFACGCEAFTKEAQALVPGIETVAVKRGMQTDPGHHLPEAAYRRHNIAAIHLAPEEARRRIRAGARRAVERAGKEDFGLVCLKAPYEMRVVTRATELLPPRVSRTVHPSSVIALLNREGTSSSEILDADPLKLASRICRERT